jgi:superfamily II DNA or RNA helicase
MSYFSDNYSALRYPVGDTGLRLAQVGAIHSIAAHFSVANDSALVVMPTGSGKSAVLLAAPFVLRAERALIITPSQLVRGQIAVGAENMSVLKRLGVFVDDFPLPRVRQVTSKLSTEDAWNTLKDYDFVVATPNCTSPEMDGVAKAPPDLFDVILIDEAHHAAADTWSALLAHFPRAKRILFTATPYRRDKKLISAKSIYTYPLRKAYEEKIFGKVNFVPVDPVNGQSVDEAIARKTEELFRADRAAGLSHSVMVRTDSKARANQLRDVYTQHTQLRLQVIHSDHTVAFVGKTIERLRKGAVQNAAQTDNDGLDGVICVSMMGEGFDFPHLKIAAVHTPHRSLAVTIQFIGRFARTSGADIGEAKFVAVPKDIAGETEELFHEGAIWSDIVPNLSEARVNHEQHVREVISGFRKIKVHRDSDSDLEFDLGSIKPFCHAKVYSVDEFTGFDTQPIPPSHFEPIQYDVNDDHHCSILLIKEQTRPRWTDYEEFSKVEYDFVLTFYNETSKHLFICSSRRDNMSLYDSVAEHYSNNSNQRLSLREINRVLHDLKRAVVFQVGMKNSVTSSNNESYQTKMGADVQGSISDTDGKLYHRGHVYLRAEENGKAETIGYSSGSKVWSNTSLRVPEIIQWCRKLGSKFARTEKVVTGTNLDLLAVGEPLVSLPENTVAVEWDDDVYKYQVEASGPTFQGVQLHDVSLEIIERKNGALRVRLVHPSMDCVLRLEVAKSSIVFCPESDISGIQIERKGESDTFLAYLKDNHFHIYLSDFGRISGSSLYQGLSADSLTLSRQYVMTHEWANHGVDISLEVDESQPAVGDKSIHGFLKALLPSQSSHVVIYDHGSGEVGDFITVEETPDRIAFGIYHCKGAGGNQPGARVGDIYEVAGQVVKSLVWIRRTSELADKIWGRIGRGSRFLKGDMSTLRGLLSKSKTKPLRFTIYCVQPGISYSQLTDKLGGPMAAARDYVAKACGGNVIFIISE